MAPTCGNRYEFGGQWVGSARARSLLLSAAGVLEVSPVARDRDAAAMVRRNWQSVAARPALFYEIVDRATVLRFSPSLD